MPLKIDILTMGVSPADQKALGFGLEAMDTVPVSLRTFDLFRPAGLARAWARLKFARADVVLFYWDMDQRPAKWMMDLTFPLFGLTGLQYSIVSQVRVPLIVMSPRPDTSFLHADLVAYARTMAVDASLAQDMAALKERIRNLHKPPVLHGKKVCIFGRPFKSSTVRGAKLTRDYVLGKTGVEIDHLPIQALKDGIRGVDRRRAEKEMQTWMDGAIRIRGDLNREIHSSVRLFLYLKDLVRDRGYHGVSISCIGKDFPTNPPIPHPCLAFSRLRDSGIAAVCEADVCALITAVLMEGVAEKPSYMGNVAFVDLGAQTVTLTHCLTALKMEGYDRPPMPYSLEDYHGTGKGVVPSVSFPVGEEVTLGLISKDLTRFMLWNGVLIESGHDFCANMARIKINDAKGFKQDILGCHYVMVYGNFIEELRDISLAMNLSVISPMRL